MLTSILTRPKLTQAEVALAFPDVPRYRKLLEQARWALERLAIGVYLVDKDGRTQRLLDHRPGLEPLSRQ